MAILRGFPPSNTIAPGIRITEKDYSFIAPEQSLHRAGLIGFASKGPINLPRLVSTNRELHVLFGNPHPDVGDPYLIYAAEQYLLVANELFVVRVADQDPVSDEQATTASADIDAAGGLVRIVSSQTGDYVFSTDSFFRWKLNGILSGKTLVVLADTYTVDDLVDELNDQLDATLDGIEFYVSNADTLAVKTTFAYGSDASLELVSVQDAIYGGPVIGGNVTGLGTGMTQASVTGTLAQYPDVAYQTPGVYDFTGLSGLNIQIVVDGTDNGLIDQVVQVIDLEDLEGQSNDIDDIVIEINSQRASESGDLPGGWICSASGNNLVFKTLHHGKDAKLRIKADSTAEALFGLSTVMKVGTTPSGQTGDVDITTLGLVVGSDNTVSDVSFVVYADSPGIEGNTTLVRITNELAEGTFRLEVYNNGVQVESWGNLTKDASSRFYVQSYLAAVSDYVRVVDDTDITAPPANGDFTLSGGTDGIPADADDQDDLLIGLEAGGTGMYALSDSEQYDIDLIACPGHSSTSVVLALLNICQSVREDCMAIIDPPFGLTVNEIVAWQNGTHDLNSTRFDSDFGALYWPWVKIRDTYNQVDVWVPPSGSVMATIARSDFLFAPWQAAAGETRGIVPGITDVYNRPSAADRDTMQGNRNAVNPIVQFSGVDDFIIMGQKTLQRRPTALDRVSVRRLLLTIEKRLRVIARGLLFDPHDDILRAKFIRLANEVLNQVRIGRGLNDFIVKCDTEINTPDVIDRNEFRAKIGIQPVRSAEFIFMEFSVHRTGSFAENADTF